MSCTCETSGCACALLCIGLSLRLQPGEPPWSSDDDDDDDVDGAHDDDEDVMMLLM